jgi:hypothetical protein
MTSNESMIANLASLEKAMSAQAAAVNEMRKALGMPEIAVAGKKAKKQRDPDAPPKAPTAWMVHIAETVADMRANGWPSWTDADGHVWPASVRGTVKDKSGAEHEAWIFPDTGKEVTQANGGMKRASFLKAQSDPAHAAKAAKYRAELAEKRSSDGGSNGSAEKEAPVADAPEAGKKKGGRPKMTEEEKAAAKAKRDAEKSGGGGGGGGPTSTAGVLNPKLAAVVASIEQQVAAAAGGGGTAVKSLKPKIGPPPVPVPKKMDLSFFPIKHEGSSYYTNDRGDLVSEDWEWVGHFDGKAIDESAPEPDDLSEATLRA